MAERTLPPGVCCVCGVDLHSPRAVGMCVGCGVEYWTAHPVVESEECPFCDGPIASETALESYVRTCGVSAHTSDRFFRQIVCDLWAARPHHPEG